MAKKLEMAVASIEREISGVGRTLMPLIKFLQEQP